MTALTRNKPRDYTAATDGAQPLADSSVVFEGACLGVDAATGRVRGLVSGDVFAGFARRKVDSNGLVGGQAPESVPLVAAGLVEMAVTGAVSTSLGASVYATDEDTFTLTGGGSLVGTVVRVPAAGVVQCQFAALVPLLAPAQQRAVRTGGLARPRNRCVIFGDSITAYYSATASNATANQNISYMAWANILLGARALQVVANLGVGGDTTADMLARIDQVLAIDAEWVVVLGGVNDLVGELESWTTPRDNLGLIYDRLRNEGRRVIAVNTLPVTAAHSNFSRQVQSRTNRLNQWIAAYCRANAGMVLVDGFGSVVDTTSSDSVPVAGDYSDVTHPGASGAYKVGKAIKAALWDLLAPVEEGPATVGDSYLAARQTITSLTCDGATATATLASHDLKVGDPITIEGATPSGYNGSHTVLAITSGTFTYACTERVTATGTIYVSNNDQLIDNPLMGSPTDGLASSWTKTESSTSGTTTNSARSSGPGNWQQLAITASGAGSIYLQGGDHLARVYAGDVVQLVADVEVDAAPTSLEGVSVYLNMIVGGVTYTPIGHLRLAGSAMPAEAWAGTLRTEEFTVPAGAVTRCRPQLYAFFSAAGGATIRWGRAYLRKVR